MTVSPLASLVRIALLIAISAVVTPICGAAQRAPEVRGTPAQRTDDGSRKPWTETVTLGETSFPLMAQLGAGAMMDAPPLLLARASDSLTTSFPASAVPQPRREETTMGLPLPEPGPLSAIIATFALAAFFFVRRAF